MTKNIFTKNKRLNGMPEENNLKTSYLNAKVMRKEGNMYDNVDFAIIEKVSDKIDFLNEPYEENHLDVFSDIEVNSQGDKIIDIKELRKEFIGRGEVKDFQFRQLYAANQAYLYEVKDEDKIHYEVFKKRINRRFATYSYPTAKSFGIWAWTYHTYEKAFQKLNSLG